MHVLDRPARVSGTTVFSYETLCFARTLRGLKSSQDRYSGERTAWASYQRSTSWPGTLVIDECRALRRLTERCLPISGGLIGVEERSRRALLSDGDDRNLLTKLRSY